MIKGNFEWSKQQMADFFTYPTYWFVGDVCGKCYKTVNVLSGPYGAGWFCECGHYNAMCWGNHRVPYEKPDYGPSWLKIRHAIIVSNCWMTWHNRCVPDWEKQFAYF